MERRKLLSVVMFLMFLLSVATVAFAEEGGANEGGAKKERGDIVYVAIALGASFSITFAAMGGAIGQGKAINGALEGIARNPGAAGKVMTPMIIGLAMIESLVIYALVISLILVGKL